MCTYPRLFACLIAATVLTAAPVDAQPSGLIVGTVNDATHAPLAGVMMTLQGAVDRTCQTEPDGGFSFQDLPEGDYQLNAALAGFAPARRMLRLGAREKVVISLTLSVLLLEQVTVTAAKTGERDLQTTPLALSVLSGSELQRGMAHTVADIAGSVPAVTFSQNSDYAQLTIRGIGSNTVFAGSDPSSAVYLDGVYIARPVMVLADFLDLERVEVLRGPQGTLYGRNAVGGALNLITKSPTNEVEASARVAAGNFNTLRTEARVSGPIVPDRILGSAAFLRSTRQGFVRDLNHPDQPLGSEDVTGVQGKLHLVLNRRSDILLSGDFTHKDPTPLTYAKVLQVKPGFQVDNPADLHEVRTSTLSSNRTVHGGAFVRLTAQLAAGATLTSLTAFRRLDFDNRNDADITELDLAAGHVREIQHQWSEELSVSQQRARLTWIGGLFLFDEADRQPVSVRLGGPQLENRFEGHVDADARGVFGQATVGLSERVSATAGLRYTHEQKTIVNAGQLSTLDSPVTLVSGSVYAYTDAIAHTAWTPKFGLDMRVHENSFAYISATRGFKSGGFNLTSRERGRGYAPEWVWSYEGGLKTDMPGRARINLAIFHTDYTDLQVQTAIVPGVIDISNAAAATIRGVELEGTTRVARAVNAGGHLAWLDANYDRYIAVGTGGVMGDVAGHRLNNAPEWSGRLWLEWNAEIGRASLASVRVDSKWQTTVFFTPFNDVIQRQRHYGLLDLTAEFGPSHRHWSVGLYARNLTNEDYITGSFSSPPPAIGGRPGAPRSVGIQLTVAK